MTRWWGWGGGGGGGERVGEGGGVGEGEGSAEIEALRNKRLLRGSKPDSFFSFFFSDGGRRQTKE